MYNPNRYVEEDSGDIVVRDSARGRWYTWEPSEDESIQMRQDERSRMDARALAWARRTEKAKYRRRQGNRAWARRQRREDRNAQVIY